MFKSLFWKEWRENRTVFIGALLSILGVNLLFYLVMFKIVDKSFLGVLEGFFLLFLIPIFAAGLASNIFAEEREKKTLNFLLMFPLSRQKIWWSKIVFSLVLILALIFYLLLLFFLLSGYINDPITVSPLLYPLLIPLTVLPVLAFAISLFAGISGLKPSFSMFVGVATTFGCFFLLGSYFKGVPEFREISNFLSFWSLPVGLTFFCFFVAYYLFIRQEN